MWVVVANDAVAFGPFHFAEQARAWAADQAERSGAARHEIDASEDGMLVSTDENEWRVLPLRNSLGA